MTTLPPPDPALVREVATTLSRARNILFVTGAGMSADSGLPTYRGVGGLYEDDDTDEGIPIEAALSASVFATRPDLTWKYIAQIEAACRDAGPNRGHEVLARIEDLGVTTTILTQNGDGLHRAAGSREIIDIHGDVHHIHCTACAYASDVDDYTWVTELPPACPECGAVLRPSVVLFDEMLDRAKVERLELALGSGFDMVFSIGTTSVFPYIAAPVHLARSLGVPSIEINPSDTPVTAHVTHKFPNGAADTLDALWREAFGD